MAKSEYHASLLQYRRYLSTVQKRPILRASLFLILSLILLVILVATALRPTLITIAGLFGQLKQQRDIEQRMDKKIAQLSQAQATLVEVQPRLSLLDEGLPKVEKFGQWAKKLEDLATRAGVEINSISISDVSINPAVGSKTGINFTFIIKGPLAQTRQVISELENLRSLVIVNSVLVNESATTIRGYFIYSL